MKTLFLCQNSSQQTEVNFSIKSGTKFLQEFRTKTLHNYRLFQIRFLYYISSSVPFFLILVFSLTGPKATCGGASVAADHPCGSNENQVAKYIQDTCVCDPIAKECNGSRPSDGSRLGDEPTFVALDPSRSSPLPQH